MESKEPQRADLERQLADLRQRVAELEPLAEKGRRAAVEGNMLWAILDLLEDCHIFAKDRESRFILTNRFFLKHEGLGSLDAVVGKTDFDFFPRDLAEQYYRDEQEVMASGIPKVNREERMLDRSGREVWLLTTKVPLRDSAGAIVGLVGMSLDVTERRKADQEREKLLFTLQEALARVKVMKGIIPICAVCKQVRDDDGFWHRVEEYVHKHTGSEFTHGLCPTCLEKRYPDLYRKIQEKKASGRIKPPLRKPSC